MVPDNSNNSSSDVMQEDAILVLNSTREAWNVYFCTQHSLPFVQRKLVHFLRRGSCLRLLLPWGCSHVRWVVLVRTSLEWQRWQVFLRAVVAKDSILCSFGFSFLQVPTMLVFSSRLIVSITNTASHAVSGATYRQENTAVNVRKVGSMPVGADV